MDDRLRQFRVGVFFLAALLATGILFALFGKVPKYWIGHYKVQVRFDNAGGIQKNAPVRKSGMLIGRVADMQLTDEDRKVLITLDIESDKTIYQNETCYITRDLLGDAAVVFAPSEGKRLPHVPIAKGTILPGKFTEDPTGLKGELQGPINTVTNTGLALTEASEKLGAAAERVETILNAKAQANVQDILNDASESLKVMRRMLGDEKNQEKLAESVRKLPDTLDGMNRTFARTDKMLREFTNPSGPDQKTPIERMVDTIEMTQRTLRRFSEPSEPGKPAPADQMAAAMDNIGEITDLLRTVIARINKGEGTLGALLNDRDLYERVDRAARNIEHLTRELRPIIEDAGVLMDKEARHPGAFLRDAIKPQAGFK